MPIVPGNEPRQAPKKGGSVLGWALPLLIFGPTLYRFARNVAGGRLTDQQFLMVVGAVVGLVVLVVIVQRVNRMRGDAFSHLPTSYHPATTEIPSASSVEMPSADSFVSGAPKYEPMVTGKVILAGVVLAALMAGVGLLLML